LKKLISLSAFFIALSGCMAGQSDHDGFETNWAHCRGPVETGVAPGGNPPVEWSETSHVKWKSEIPGIGHSTPIIWGDQIFLLTAVQTDRRAEPEKNGENQEGEDSMNPRPMDFIHRFEVISVDRTTGRILWQTTVREEVPFSSTHEFGSWASNSPVTDGEHIYAYFGSYGLYCLNMKGDILWEKDLGRMVKKMDFGDGSSPILYGNILFLLRDQEGQSNLLAMDKGSGEIIWEVERDEVSSWSTPLLVEYNGAPQLITSASALIRSYDPETGKVLWSCGGMTSNVIPSPVYADGIVYLMSGYRGNAILAIDLSKASGDITGTDAIVWSYDKNTTPYTPCPVLMDGKLWFLKANNGSLTCLNAKDGTEYYANETLEGIRNIFTSPVAVADRLYIVGTNGVTYVVKAGEEFEVLAENTLEDNFIASPVIIGNDLFIRGYHALYCISGN
jgi:outer membrane protein assembly factor BamB